MNYINGNMIMEMSVVSSADKRRIDCVTDIMQLLHHMKQSELTRWGHNVLLRRCPPDSENCIKSHSTLINVIGQVQSPEAQKLIVNDVMKRNSTEDDLQRAIFHLHAQSDPIPVCT